MSTISILYIATGCSKLERENKPQPAIYITHSHCVVLAAAAATAAGTI